ncbi:hypothetical protein FDP41_012328 [Naegleria fowleri]|uniref:non-specific serine/threonine protein kinase n=1 Tax=Naegleria fowleri TaxID=5763 RepID=A0A6A5C3M5_NAEFO|nr:uncharacterized protein FDP41_012328 [Naegleria fowleri]KAF0981671.1 hypothetical protein FDP41_012328 [Naegleria fowleri]
MSYPNNDDFLADSIHDEETNSGTQEKIGPFILKKTLGEGSTGKVKLAIHKDTGDKVAIKIINKKILTHKPHLKKKVEREIAVMKMIRHKHIIRLYDVLQTKKYLFLIMEYVEGGELFDYIVERGRLTIEEAFHFFKQIILGVEYCHKQLICHRDLKPENLLLDRYKNIKIADFGMASLMEEGKLLETSCGSPHYASPEIVRGLKYNGMEADIWSMGVILYALLTGRLPFDDETLHVLLAKVKEGKYEIPQFLDEDVRDLISKMLKLNPSERITIKGIKNHPWWRKMEKKMSLVEQTLHHTSSSEEISQQDAIQEKLLQHKLENSGASSSEVTTENNVQETTITPENIEPTDQDVDSTPKKEEEYMVQLDENSIDPEVFQKNLETVLYNLILQYKRELGTAQTNVFNTSKYSVGPCNPLTVPVDKAAELRKRLQEANGEDIEQEPVNEPSGEKEQTGIKWFAFWRKKKTSQKDDSSKKKQTPSQYGLHSRKTQSEILAEVTRVFKVLHIQFEKASESTVRFGCTFPVIKQGEQGDTVIGEKQVIMDMTMSALENDGFVLNFTLVSGKTSDARILFDALQDEAEL